MQDEAWMRELSLYYPNKIVRWCLFFLQKRYTPPNVPDGESSSMIGKPGPFQIIEDDGNGNVDCPTIPPRRRYSCTHYQTCLNLAAALNWDNFTCRGCSGEMSESLVWRARLQQKKDILAGKICDLPHPIFLEGKPEEVTASYTNERYANESFANQADEDSVLGPLRDLPVFASLKRE